MPKGVLVLAEAARLVRVKGHSSIKWKYDITKIEYEVLAEFRYTLSVFMSFSENAAREVRIHPQQSQALLAIKSFPGREQITISELSKLCRLSTIVAWGYSTVSKAKE